MVEEDAVDGVLGHGQVGAHGHAVDRVLLDDIPFGLGQGAALVEDAPGDPGLADVVQQCAQAALVGVRVAHAEGLEHGHRIDEHMHAVGVGLVVVGNERGHGGQGLVRGQKTDGVLDDLGDAGKMSGPDRAWQLVVEDVLHDHGGRLVEDLGADLDG